MNRYPHEPLTPEERELAQLTGRLGPHGEPSPALDARVLAAAHAAVAVEQARKPKPRWPVAMGLAASVVLAVGVAWQLRPLQQMVTVSEAPVVASDTAAASAEAGAAAAPVAQANLQESESAPEAFAKTEAEPAILPAVEPVPAQPSRMPEQVVGTAKAIAPADTTRNRTPGRETDAYSPPSPPAPPAPVAAAAPPPPPPPAMTASAPKGLVAQESPPESPMAFAEEADAVADMAVVAETESSNTRAAPTGQQAAARAEAKARSAAATARESASLDRVEVSGSRLKRTDLQVPVSDDARLPVNDWLERVRTRYGLGDEEAARQSLLLFVKDHPREPVPDDLEPLLEP
jgi:hypothetical protein